MRIGMVLAKPFPPDIRVVKEAQALCDAGYQVGLLAQSVGGDTPLEETTTYGLRIYRATVSRQPVWARQIKDFTLLEKVWLKPLERFVACFHPDVLHVHDFPLVHTGLHIARQSGLPVIADLHENMPAAFRVWRTYLDPIRRTRDAIFRNYYLWRWHEKRVLRHCARILVVVPEAAERLYRDGIAEDKIVVVSNTEDVTTFDVSQADPDILERYCEKWTVSYVGGVGPHRGVDTAIRAVPTAARQIPGFRLVVVGVRSNRQSAPVSRLIRQLKVDKNVDIVGWQPFEKVSSYIAASAVCLVPHNDSEHTQTTIPHKLFQYMMAGKPVVVSNVRPLKRIVEETQSGLVFEADDPSSLAQALIKLYHTPNLAERLGRNGRQAAIGPYAWRHDAERLVEVYRQIRKDIEQV